jgi:hypothetical protein
LKTPEEFAEAMKGKETFSLKRLPEGPFTVQTTKRKVPINIWWPEITNAEEADRASKMGSGAAICIAVATAIAATISVVINAPVVGVNANGYIDAAIFAFIAWGIRCRSNFVSAAGLAIYVSEKGYQFSTQPKSVGVFMTIFLLCGFISGIRGTRAYWRFAPEKAAAQAKSFKALWKTPGIWTTLVLSGVTALVMGLSLLRVLARFLHPSAVISYVPSVTPWGYVRAALIMMAAITAIFAITLRPHWGRASCMAFALVFAFSCLWVLYWRVSIDVAAGVAAWTASIGLLSGYLFAVFLSEGAERYFRALIDDSTGVTDSKVR